MKNVMIVAFSLLLLGSCKKDFIELTPPSNLNSSKFYNTPGEINNAVLSAYAGLRSIYNGVAYRLGEIRSDNTTYSWLPGNTSNQDGIDIFAAPLTPSNDYVEDCWDNCYNVILRCNIVIDHIDKVKFKDAHLKDQYMAEAKFIRALSYFWLNRVFGGYSKAGELLGVIGVYKEITPAEALTMTRSSLQEVYDTIVADLKYAKQNLPENYGGTDIGRVTKWGATGLLCKIYMTMAGYPLNKGVEYYKLAIQEAEEVINNSGAALVPSYKDLFDVSKKNGSESLFEVQYQKGGPGGETGSPWNNDFAPRFSNKEVVLVGDKGGANAPTDDMSNTYELGDPRKYVSMRDFWVSAADGTVHNDKYVCKYYDVASSGNDNGNNWIVLRLADIYLLYAEALVRTGGDENTALFYLNKIRERARNTPGDPSIPKPDDLLKDYAVSDFANKNELLLAIAKERRVELAFEDHRWFYLVRTGRAKDVMIAEQTADGYPSFTWSDDMLSYPIPRNAMQANPGKIIQNKGYTQF